MSSKDSGTGPLSMRVVSRDEQRISPWVRIVAKGVVRPESDTVEVFHCLALPDYIAVLAVTPDGTIPLVRQFRPAVEAHPWELPAGLVEAGEDPSETCRRELVEETGLHVESLECLGSFYSDTGRLENRLHAYFARTSAPDPGFRPEAGLELDFVNRAGLRRMIVDREFRHQLHLGVLALASLDRRRIDLGDGAS